MRKGYGEGVWERGAEAEGRGEGEGEGDLLVLYKKI